MALPDRPYTRRQIQELLLPKLAVQEDAIFVRVDAAGELHLSRAMDNPESYLCMLSWAEIRDPSLRLLIESHIKNVAGEALWQLEMDRFFDHMLDTAAQQRRLSEIYDDPAGLVEACVAAFPRTGWRHGANAQRTRQRVAEDIEKMPPWMQISILESDTFYRLKPDFYVPFFNNMLNTAALVLVSMQALISSGIYAKLDPLAVFAGYCAALVVVGNHYALHGILERDKTFLSLLASGMYDRESKTVYATPALGRHIFYHEEGHKYDREAGYVSFGEAWEQAMSHRHFGLDGMKIAFTMALVFQAVQGYRLFGGKDWKLSESFAHITTCYASEYKKQWREGEDAAAIEARVEARLDKAFPELSRVFHELALPEIKAYAEELWQGRNRQKDLAQGRAI